MSIHYCQVINYIIYISKSLSHQFRVIFKYVQRVKQHSALVQTLDSKDFAIMSLSSRLVSRTC